MVSKADMMNRFMKLEKVKFPEREGFKSVKSITEVTDESIMIPVNKTCYYELFDHYDPLGKEFKIFNDKTKEFWLVEVQK